ncbi:hypothetical protein IF1G_11415 [Cordyceps javanica]|uniref:Uncharacterized protein n=1 Tax=Cordyceps javanica TaxID=43265 RepID=A0A545UKD1_9HYPO|nr:hypothetical protein IF1G_11415 [Cordyceps javanica]
MPHFWAGKIGLEELRVAGGHPVCDTFFALLCSSRNFFTVVKGGWWVCIGGQLGCSALFPAWYRRKKAITVIVGARNAYAYTNYTGLVWKASGFLLRLQHRAATVGRVARESW